MEVALQSSCNIVTIIEDFIKTEGLKTNFINKWSNLNKKKNNWHRRRMQKEKYFVSIWNSMKITFPFHFQMNLVLIVVNNQLFLYSTIDYFINQSFYP